MLGSLETGVFAGSAEDHHGLSERRSLGLLNGWNRELKAMRHRAFLSALDTTNLPDGRRSIMWATYRMALRAGGTDTTGRQEKGILNRLT